MAFYRLQDLRQEYETEGLSESEVASDPLGQFDRWMREAITAGIAQPNAVVLASADGKGHPSARAVLLKEYDQLGFVFYTNLESRKAAELATGRWASLCFLWMDLHRQVRIEGMVELVGDEQADRYFASRPRSAQLAAWASPQSRVVANRKELEERLAELEAQHEGALVPRPPHWGGLRVVPQCYEFWQGRRHRLHDRLVFRLQGQSWLLERLAP